jgi:uncharacterized protein
LKLCVLPKKNQDQANKSMVDKKNRAMEKAFSKVPFGDRIIFVPHCMRNAPKCKAKDEGSYYLCLECAACKIGPISKKSKELGYKGIFVLKGGKALSKHLKQLSPRAALGIACYFEGVQGMREGEKHKIPIQFVPLTKDGCVDTDADLKDVFKAMEQK